MLWVEGLNESRVIHTRNMTETGIPCAVQRIEEDDHVWDAALSDRSTEAAPSEVSRAVRFVLNHTATDCSDLHALLQWRRLVMCIYGHPVGFVVQAVHSKYRAAFEAGLQALCQAASNDSRPPQLLPHIYGSAEYLGDSSAGLGPPDKPAAGAAACMYAHSCPFRR